MKFKLIPRLPDGGGDLEITAETGDEVRVLVKEYKLFCVAGCDTLGRLKALEKEKAALESGTHTVVRMHKPKTMDGVRAWYSVEGNLGGDHPHPYLRDRQLTFLDPYKELLKRNLGYEGPIPDMTLVVPPEDVFKATRILTDVWIKDETIHYKAFDEASPWNNMDGPTTAAHYVRDHLGEEFGGRRHEPEYIPAGSLMKHNPDYMKRHKPTPAIGNEWLLNALLDWWRTNQATPGQERVLKAAEELGKISSSSGTPLKARYSGGIANFTTTYSLDYTIYYLDPNGDVHWDDKGTKVSAMKWEEFAKLKD